ncbi:MAG: signal peptide peptidase SppA [Anaerolineae bacterium]|nr:signal peptide peptidase SppA [Anaerolineae bacterium]
MSSPVEAAPKQRRRKVWLWVGGGVVALVALWGAATCALIGLSSGQVGSPLLSLGGDAVALIPIEGAIGVSSLTGGAAVDGAQIVRFVEQAEANARVKAIVVYINSPGGSVVPSALMYRALREAEKPVVAAMGDVAASGGYYVACGADRVIAHPASITGSIGVYGQLINAADLLETLGVEGIIVRSGDSKAVGNWFEHPTEEQLAIEQEIVDELHALFIQAVAEGRELDEERVRELADGRPYTGQQALALGLVDSLGSVSDAIEAAAELGGIEGDPEIFEYRRSPSLLETWLARQAGTDERLALLRWLEEQVVVPLARYVAP